MRSEAVGSDTPLATAGDPLGDAGDRIGDAGGRLGDPVALLGGSLGDPVDLLGRQLGEAVDELDALLSRIAAHLDVDLLGGAQAAGLARRFAAFKAQCGAIEGRLARRVATTGQFVSEGYRSPESWLAGETGETQSAARTALMTAQACGQLTGLEAALSSGQLSGAQAAEVARGGLVDPAAEAELLEVARTGSLHDLRAKADQVEAAARSREDDERRYARIRATRHLRTWRDGDGSFRGKFSLTPDDGALLMAGIEQEANHLFDIARREGRRQPREAYLADALVAVVSGGASGVSGPPTGHSGTCATLTGAGGGQECCTPAGDRRGSRAGDGASGSGDSDRCHEHADSEERVDNVGRTGGGDDKPAAGGEDEPNAPESAGAGPPSAIRRGPGRTGTDHTILMRIDLEALVRGSLGPGEECSIDGVGPVPISVVERYLKTAGLRLVITEGYDIHSIIKFSRVIPKALQTALQFRDRTCVVPGCSSTFHLETDHIVEVNRGGPTSLANLCRLCRYHHSLKSNRGYRIAGGPGKWRWIPPPNENPGAPAGRSTGTRSDPSGDIPRRTSGRPARSRPPSPPSATTPSQPASQQERLLPS